MNSLIKFKIKIMVLALCLSSFCVGQELAELIDKCDFVNFKQAYEGSGLSESEKAELLKVTDRVIDESLKKFKIIFDNKLPNSNDLYELKRNKYLFSAFSVICGGLSLALIGIIYDISYRIKNVNTGLFALPAATEIATLINRGKANNFKKLLDSRFLFGILFGANTLAAIISYYFYRRNELAFFRYNQYKKALKIKQLIQQPITNAPVTAENSEPVKVGA